MGSPWQPVSSQGLRLLAMPRLEGSGAKTGWTAHQGCLKGVWNLWQPTVCELGEEEATILL